MTTPFKFKKKQRGEREVKIEGIGLSVPRVSGRDEVREITLAAILQGSTKRPVDLNDLVSWLVLDVGRIEMGDIGRQKAKWGVTALGFLMDFQRYQEEFNHLSLEDKNSIPSPYELLSATSLPEPQPLRRASGGLRTISEDPGEGFCTPPDRAMNVAVNAPVAPTAVAFAGRQRSSALPTSHPVPISYSRPTSSRILQHRLNPVQSQPLYPHQQSLVGVYLTNTSALNDYSGSYADRLRKFFETARDETTRTTHPEAMEGLAREVRNVFENDLLKEFLHQASQNLRQETARGRFLVGFLLTALAITATVLLALRPSPFLAYGLPPNRAYRILTIPLYLSGLNYLLSSWSHVCIWLALFGLRERRAWEILEEPAVDEEKGNLDDWEMIPTTMGKGGPTLSITITPPDTVDLTSISSRELSLTTPPPKYEQEPCELVLPSRESTLSKVLTSNAFVSFWRWTGSPWNTCRVDDPTMRHSQLRTAYNMAALISVTLVGVTVIVMSVP